MQVGISFHAHTFFFLLTEQDAGQFFIGIPTNFSAERGRIQSRIMVTEGGVRVAERVQLSSYLFTC